jgi:uncharacterized protein YdaU (DUF1376 family)
MSNRLPWFKCCPEKLLSALTAMESDEGYIYVHILLRIYEVGGPISDPIRALARRAGMTERRATAAINLLIESGKVNMTEDGKIDSVTTHETLEEMAGFRDGQSRAAKIGAEKRAEKKQQKQQNEAAVATPTPSQLRQETIDTTSLRSVVSRDEKKTAVRGCRLPSGWTPNDEGRAMASQAFGNSGARAQLEKFRDWAASAPGQKGVKADWDATWRNWIRREADAAKPRAGPGPRPNGRETLTQIALGNFFDDEPSDQAPPQFSPAGSNPADRYFDLDLSEQTPKDAGGQILDFGQQRAVWR